MEVNAELKPTTEPLTKEGKPDVILESLDKDHYKLVINGMIVGVMERSQLRQLIGSIDNNIT